jgi:hypothetical protein
VGKDLEEGGCGQFQDAIGIFRVGVWGQTRKTLSGLFKPGHICRSVFQLDVFPRNTEKQTLFNFIIIIITIIITVINSCMQDIYIYVP